MYSYHYCIEDRKDFLNYYHLLPDLAPWLNLSGLNYPLLKQFSIVPKMFELLKVDCSLVSFYIPKLSVKSWKYKYLSSRAISLVGLRDWIQRDFLPFLQGRQLPLLSVCLPPHQAPSEKGSTLKGKNLLPFPSEKGSTPKGKNLLPRGANFFLLE